MDCFQILAIINNPATNIAVHILFQISASVLSLDILPEVDSLGYKAVSFLIF